jgi:diguanylate cyclase (GGDEF)-like protein
MKNKYNDNRLAEIADKEFSCSVGIALYKKHGSTYAELYEKADKAMYYVKANGKNNYSFAENI